MRLTSVEHRLVDRVRRLVRKDARGEAGDAATLELLADKENIIVHQHVLPEKLDIVLQVVEESAYLGSEVDDVRRRGRCEKCARRIDIEKVAVAAREKDPLFALCRSILCDRGLNAVAHQARASRYENLPRHHTHTRGCHWRSSELA